MFANLTRTQLIIIGVVGLTTIAGIIVGTVITTTINKPPSLTSDKLKISSVKIEWKLFDSNTVPLDNVFIGGTDSDGESIYVCRVNSTAAKEILPGTYDPVTGSCTVTYGGRAYTYRKFDLLTTDNQSGLIWLYNEKGKSSLGSIISGISDLNDELGVARTMISGGQAIGKVHGRHSKAYVPFAGKETEITEYETLCVYDVNLG